MRTPSVGPPALPPGGERVLSRYEAAWRNGVPQSLDAFLPPAGAAGSDAAARRTLLEELIKIDLENRWRRASAASGVPPEQIRTASAESWPDQPLLEHYLARFPELGPASQLSVELIAEEYWVRHCWGDRPPAAAYLARFPAQASMLSAALARRDAELAESSQEDGSGTVEASQSPGSMPSQPAAETTLPSVPGYELLHELGRGGMGVVYLARQVSLKRLVALKMVLSGAWPKSAERARFHLEAEALAHLQHPNIVQIYEIGECQGIPYFSLEFVDGGTLKQKLASRPQPAREAAALVEILARATHAAHQRGIVHRDLKPTNILLNRDGTPKIADFGLAKRLNKEGHTRTGAILGTPCYMAPEQAAGRRKEIGPATDVYALGVTLYEMLTGQPPFSAATALDTMQQVRFQEPVPPSRLHSGVPSDLEAICLKCLQKCSAARYASAASLADALKHFLASEPVMQAPIASHGNVGPAGPVIGRDRRVTMPDSAGSITEQHELTSLVVAQSGSADCRTIGEALRRVGARGRIAVRPGTYREHLLLNKPVKIVGEGAVADIVVESNEAPCLIFKGDAVVRGLSLIGKMPADDKQQQASAVLVTEGKPTIENCRVTSSGAGIAVSGIMAAPTIRGTEIHGCGAEGIIVCDDAQCMIDKCDVWGNKESGLAIAKGGNPTVRHCTIRDGKAGGILVTDGGLGLIEDCEIFGNRRTNVSVKRYSQPVVRRCKICNSRESAGVTVSEGCAGRFEECDISRNRATGVLIRKGANPTLRRCRIHDQADQGGLLVLSKGRGVVEECDIFGNKLAGVTIRSGGNPMVRHCRIHDSRADSGISAYEGGLGTIEDCEIFGNKLAGVEIKQAGNPTIRRCCIQHNGFYAVNVHDRGQGMLLDCELSGNMYGTANIQGNCPVRKGGNKQ
jgi:serine/threonine protein kinase